MKTIGAVLRKTGPALTTEIIAEMEKQGISAVSARQRIFRAGSEITRLAGLRFPHNARFIYLPEQFGDGAYWTALERVFREHGKSYWGAVVGLRARGGAFPRKYFANICGCPLSRQRQLSPERVFDRLSAINLLEEVVDSDSGEPFVKFKPQAFVSDPFSTIKARLVAEDVVLHGIKEWCRRIGFGSFGSVRLRGDPVAPLVSGITWDMTAPSYARPLVAASNTGMKPGFIVCDVNLFGSLTEDDVAVFVRKHDLASAPQKVAPIMPFLLADRFSSASFDLARTKGILATTTAQLFGDDVAKALRDLIVLLSDMGATAAANPEHVVRVLNSLTRIEGAANNLRGALFEIIVGSLVKDVEGGYLRAGEQWMDSETYRSAEIDVLLDRPDGKSVLIIECKSKIPGGRVNLTEVYKWRNDRIPLIYKILRNNEHFANKKLTFELWTNGPIAADAVAWLKADPVVPDYEISWKDGETMKAYVDKASSVAIRKAMSEHYFRHPLARLARHGRDQQ